MKTAQAKIVKQTGAPLTLAALDAMPLQAAGDEWSEAQRWSRAASMFEKGKLAAQVMAGFALQELHEKHGVSQGARSDLNFPNRSGSWEKIVKEKCGISDDTARNWMAMAKEAAKRLKKLNLDGNVTFRELMELPVDQWSDKQMQIVTSAIAKLTDGKNQLDFMRELGLAKKPIGHGLKNSKREHRQKNGADDGEEDSPAQAAIDLWKPIIEDLESEGLKEKSFADLPKAWLKRLKGTLIDLNKLVPAK